MFQGARGLCARMAGQDDFENFGARLKIIEKRSPGCGFFRRDARQIAQNVVDNFAGGPCGRGKTSERNSITELIS